MTTQVSTTSTSGRTPRQRARDLHTQALKNARETIQQNLEYDIFDGSSTCPEDFWYGYERMSWVDEDFTKPVKFLCNHIDLDKVRVRVNSAAHARGYRVSGTSTTRISNIEVTPMPICVLTFTFEPKEQK